ncbi:hypothetical protein ThvES_00008120 [Thiovulum sp. ES]|nr:hypothetical protein ThvES_00008120 [Thiovulum sp. ES]
MTEQELILQKYSTDYILVNKKELENVLAESGTVTEALKTLDIVLTPATKTKDGLHSKEDKLLSDFLRNHASTHIYAISSNTTGTVYPATTFEFNSKDIDLTLSGKVARVSLKDSIVSLNVNGDNVKAREFSLNTEGLKSSVKDTSISISDKPTRAYCKRQSLLYG